MSAVGPRAGLGWPVLALLLAGAAVMLAPMLWALLLSFKANAALMADSAAALSPPYTFANYRAIFTDGLTSRWLLNSIIVSLGTTAGVLVLSSLAGFAFARLDFPFRRALFLLVLMGLAIPEQAVILPRHQLFAQLHLHNSYVGLILPGLTGSFGVFFMTQYFRAIPADLDEAALLDGASRFRLFWSVLLPLTVPAQATLGVFTFLASWNDYWWPLISATTSDHYTLTVGLASAQMNYAQTSGLGFLMAQAVFASIPILIVYVAFQKQIVRAMAGGGAAVKWLATLLLGLLAGCAPADPRPEIVVQRFFGECGALYGHSTDVAKADTECGILTTIFNRFEAENPDIRLKVNVVAWPGYPQLAAQIAAGDPPDLVTMHQSVIADYQGRGLLAPMDGMLKRAAIDPATFTPAARAGVVKDGQIYGMPWDTIGRLFHINTRLMAQAGLMAGGKPVLPHSPDELLQQARQFRARTGKPYLVQAEVNAPDFAVAMLYTYLLAQDATIFPDARHVRLDTPAARRVVTLMRRINAEGLSTRNQDFPAATASFTRGDGGIFPVGTWMIGPYDAEAARPGSALYRAYAIAPFPRLWGHDAAFVDGHAWVMPRAERRPAELAAIARFLAFLARHDGDWARTGQLPALAPVLDTAAFRALPHRSDIAAIARTGEQLPDHVRRQNAIQGLIGEELVAAITGIKPVDQALADAERRVNQLYAEML